MPYGLYVSADGVNAQSKRLEVLSNNLANIDTTGFKRQFAVFQARYSEAVEESFLSPGTGTIDDLNGGVSLNATLTDFTSGKFKRTGDATDLAIAGDGFFQVEKNGETLLTRAGNFVFSADGELKTQQGFSVLDEGGSPISISPGGGPTEFGPDGTIFQIDEAGKQVPLQKIGLVSPGAPDLMVRQGENSFRTDPQDSVTPIPLAQRQFRSGFLEQSTVNATTSMMELIEASRAMEANVNMIRNHDSMLGTLVNRVLRQS